MRHELPGKAEKATNFTDSLPFSSECECGWACECVGVMNGRMYARTDMVVLLRGVELYSCKVQGAGEVGNGRFCCCWLNMIILRGTFSSTI